MIIKDNDNCLIVTDNLLTNLPISRLSSIPTVDGLTDGIGDEDKFLLSKKCEPGAENMTETGYMSYYVLFKDIGTGIQRLLGLRGLCAELDSMVKKADNLLQYSDMLSAISCSSPSVYCDIYGKDLEFNPFVISAIIQHEGVLSSVEGFRLLEAISSCIDHYNLNSISAKEGYFEYLRYGQLDQSDISDMFVGRLSASTERAENDTVNRLSVNLIDPAGGQRNLFSINIPDHPLGYEQTIQALSAADRALSAKMGMQFENMTSQEFISAVLQNRLSGEKTYLVDAQNEHDAYGDRIVNVGDPVYAFDAVNKQYVDAAVWRAYAAATDSKVEMISRPPVHVLPQEEFNNAALSAGYVYFTY